MLTRLYPKLTAFKKGSNIIHNLNISINNSAILSKIKWSGIIKKIVKGKNKYFKSTKTKSLKKIFFP